ncbi:endonuclease/exonuclease/phosphatase family protein [Flindersiella endophytica]
MALRRRYLLLSLGAACTIGIGGVSMTAYAGSTYWGAEAAELTIPEIQGPTHLSPHDADEVSTSGVVTARKFDGYWLQDAKGDGDDRTSDGIFVYTGSSGAKPEVGQSVKVSGTVDEFRPSSASGPNLNVTEIVRSSFTVQAGDTPLPAAVRIGPGGRQTPAQQVDSVKSRTDIETATFDPAHDALDFYETLEGMLVDVKDAEVVGPTNSFGELTVLPGGTKGLPRTIRGGVRYASYTKPNAQRLTVDDEIVYRLMPAANVGDTLAGEVTGPLAYDFNTFRIYPKAVPTVRSGGLKPEVTGKPGAGELAVASYNVENLDPTDPQSSFDRHARTIVDNLGSPDVVALEEIQDNTGAECPDGPSDTCTPDGVVDADKTLNQLTAAIEAAGGPAYEWRQVSPENLTDGGEPTGNIRQAFLFRTDRGVKFADRGQADATTPTEVRRTAGKAQLTLSPGRVDPANEAFQDSRKPLAGEFDFRGRPYFVVANHLNSKGGDEPLTGRWQPPNRSSETQRHAQATVLNDFVKSVQAAQPTANVVVLGDINDFEFSETSQILTGGDALVDLPRTLPAAERYSYVFQGNSQVLDHILVSPSTYAQVTSYDSVHVNAEFADQASDHDPQVVRIRVG